MEFLNDVSKYQELADKWEKKKSCGRLTQKEEKTEGGETGERNKW